MKFAELTTKSERELHDLLSVKREELRELRFKASEGQLNTVRVIREAKKTIARILTALKTTQN